MLNIRNNIICKTSALVWDDQSKQHLGRNRSLSHVDQFTNRGLMFLLVLNCQTDNWGKLDCVETLISSHWCWRPPGC